MISSGHFLYSYNPVLDICSWSFLGCFPFPKFLLLESSVLVPILCLSSAPLLFTVFRTQKNATPSSFLCKTLISYFPSENTPLSVCILSPFHPLPLLIESALPCSNTLISLLPYLLPYLLQVSLPITPFLQGL